jgi:pyridoxamine 5'-phosphate oxidase
MSEGLRDAWLGEDPLPEEPVAVVKRWLAEATAEGRQEIPHAVALATADPDGRPSVRMVLCVAIDVAAGAFTFHSNRESRKGRALAADPRAAIVFHWSGRQARIEGDVAPAPDDVSERYFASRPLEARLSAWASRQSEPVASRAALLADLAAVAERFGARAESDPVPRPPHWGGFVLTAREVELWASRPGRIHDRALFRRRPGGWHSQRLQP